MKSGVYYLYEYKNDQKSRNVGFLKFTQDSDSCFLQICTRGISVFHGDLASLCTLFPSEENIFVIPSQTIPCENHAIICKLTLSSSELESSDCETSFCGFLIELPDKTHLVAMEDGFTFSTAMCRTLPEKIDGNEDEVAKSATESDVSCVPTVKPTDDDSCVPTAKPVDENGAGCVPTAKLVDESGTGCVPATKPIVSATGECDASSTTNASSPQQTIRKIQRADLSILPRRYWNISNNRFLLHGYYNYNHLLLVEEENYFLVGVPGIYDKREARAADLFGFPTFSESYTKSLDLSSDETSTQGQFGYWCKKLPTIPKNIS